MSNHPYIQAENLCSIKNICMIFWHIIEAVIMNNFLGLHACFILLLHCSVYRGIYCEFRSFPPSVYEQQFVLFFFSLTYLRHGLEVRFPALKEASRLLAQLLQEVIRARPLFNPANNLKI